jgi:hypothetical protein
MTYGMFPVHDISVTRPQDRRACTARGPCLHARKEGAFRNSKHRLSAEEATD